MAVIQNGVGITTLLNGATVKQALDAANETVAKGIYDATTLSAVDADLDVGNIKVAENIFGFVGTVEPSGVETLERYYSLDLTGGTTYTPSDSGIFFVFGMHNFSPYYGGYSPMGQARFRGFTAIGDGSTLGIKSEAATEELLIMRHHITTWTYEKYYDADLAQNTAYVPADGGFFAVGTEWTAPPVQINLVSTGWVYVEPTWNTDMPLTISIGDGTNWRLYQTSPPQYMVLLRCSLG